MTEIVKINHAEFGLEESKAKQIADQFKPMLDKMVELEKEFNEVAKLEPSKEASAKAKELRLKYVKVRTGTAEIHKQQKSFYLQAGRYVDGWKNAQLFASQGIEEKLQEIETHFDRIEAARVEALRVERWTKLSKYIEIEPIGLGTMESLVFDNLLSGTKAAYEARVEAERKADEERIAKEKADSEERERIRLENERLKKEAEAREKQIQQEREKAEAERKAIEEKARIEREEAERKLSEERAKVEAERKAKEDAERREREKIEAIERERIEKEKQERERLEAEEKAKIEAQKKAERAPDKQKLIDLAESFESVEMPSLKTKEAEYILNSIKELKGKLVNYIIEKSGAL